MKKKVEKKKNKTNKSSKKIKVKETCCCGIKSTWGYLWYFGLSFNFL